MTPPVLGHLAWGGVKQSPFFLPFPTISVLIFILLLQLSHERPLARSGGTAGGMHELQEPQQKQKQQHSELERLGEK